MLHVLDFIFPPRDTEVSVRELGISGLAPQLVPRTLLLRELEVTALLHYEDPVVRASILEAKFHGNTRAQHILGDVLARYLEEECAEQYLYEKRAFALVPLPLSGVRKKERGYNQVEEVALRAARQLRIPVVTSLLQRARDTLPQTSLEGKAERVRNVRGAFAPRNVPDPEVTYFLIDDVVTTGATLCEAVRVLRNAGGRIIPLALAH
ncbi:MAG TPA: phosphoribosyltransferase family protein [Candidatus Paceibacterota bacterium]|jgi:ComF family protein